MVNAADLRLIYLWHTRRSRLSDGMNDKSAYPMNARLRLTPALARFHVSRVPLKDGAANPVVEGEPEDTVRAPRINGQVAAIEAVRVARALSSMDDESYTPGRAGPPAGSAASVAPRGSAPATRRADEMGQCSRRRVHALGVADGYPH